jgi:hypothetical protein
MGLVVLNEVIYDENAVQAGKPMTATKMELSSRSLMNLGAFLSHEGDISKLRKRGHF